MLSTLLEQNNIAVLTLIIVVLSLFYALYAVYKAGERTNKRVANEILRHAAMIAVANDSRYVAYTQTKGGVWLIKQNGGKEKIQFMDNTPSGIEQLDMLYRILFNTSQKTKKANMLLKHARFRYDREKNNPQLTTFSKNQLLVYYALIYMYKKAIVRTA